MIPTVLLIGFVGGLVPRGCAVVPVAALAWPVLLLAGGVESGVAFALGAGALAAANVAAGFAVGWTLRRAAVRLVP